MLWTDRNHDGLSQSDELASLASSNISDISLDYRESRRQDRYGNRFRYISAVRLGPAKAGARKSFAVDVIFKPLGAK